MKIKRNSVRSEWSVSVCLRESIWIYYLLPKARRKSIEHIQHIVFTYETWSNMYISDEYKYARWTLLVECLDVDFFRMQVCMYLIAVIGPATELHVTVLIVKGEPSDVYLACALEDTRRNVQATAVVFDHNVCVVSPVETFVCTVRATNTNLCYSNELISVCFSFQIVV